MGLGSGVHCIQRGGSDAEKKRKVSISRAMGFSPHEKPGTTPRGSVSRAISIASSPQIAA
jgi:hypothetical protein